VSHSSGRRPIAWLVTATLVTCLAWAWLIPPFEGPDESAFYKGLIDAAHGRVTGGRSRYAIVMMPAIRLAGGQDRPFEGRYNPAFRFISNQRGRVNMYRYTLYVGVEIAGNLGPPFPLGAVGTPHP
jgi:hypothetical protein